MVRDKINSGECAAAMPGTLITVPWNKSPATNRRVTPASTPDAGLATDIILEKRPPNGDVYIGAFYGKTPHGSGKYVWRDGCVYDGEWKKGKASGHGRLCWPSGVIFEGEFRSGRMDGFGTFTGVDGDVYSGSWSGDRKQGYGVKHFSNGDYYEGYWKRNLLDGHGTYLWENGNQYIGEWKNGTIHGRGVLVWNNGNRYAGNWHYGDLKGGHRIFTWTNRSCYTGCWWSKAWKNHNNRQQILNRTFHPAQSSKNGNENDCLKMYSDHKLLTPLVGKESLNVMVNNGGNNKCSPPDDAVTGIEQCRRNCFFFNGGEVKKPGQMISKGHKSCDLMRSLQLGIRHSLCRHDSISCDLKATDFDPKEEFWTRFPSRGSGNTPPHPSPEFWSKDYCPVVFRYLRKLFKVDSAGYMSTICGDDGLRELSSPGKSGSSFYLTRDDRYMIKTVKKSELKVLMKMLPSYYLHVSRYENSLITKFYGVHCVKPVGGFKTWFVVMGNLLLSERQIHRRFDLKGSSHGRTANRTKGETDETITLKDLDLNYMFHLQANWYEELIKQIHRDCEFLERQRIMDYSLLVGLHFLDNGVIDKIGNGDLNRTEKFMGGCCFVDDESQETNRVLSGRKPMTRLGTTNMPAGAERVARRRDLDRYTRPGFSYPTPSHDGEIYEVVLYLGIIDILQNYDITKKIEHAYKSLKADPSSISAVNPKRYSRRFRNFVGKIFVEGR